MSTTSVLAHYAASVPPAASVPAVSAPAPADGVDAVVDPGAVSAAGSGGGVQNHLSHAVQQALGRLQDQQPPTTGTPGKDMPPITMEGFIQALIASLHQLGGTPTTGQAVSQQAELQAVASSSGRYEPQAANDVQNLIKQSATVLSSNTVLQQDFQSMLRAAGIDQSSTSLNQFLRTVSSQMKTSSVISAIA